MAEGRETRTTFAEQVPLPVAMATYALRQYLKKQKNKTKKNSNRNTLFNFNFYCRAVITSGRSCFCVQSFMSAGVLHEVLLWRFGVQWNKTFDTSKAGVLHLHQWEMQNRCWKHLAASGNRRLIWTLWSRMECVMLFVISCKSTLDFTDCLKFIFTFSGWRPLSWWLTAVKCFHGGNSDKEPLVGTSELVLVRDVMQKAESVLSPPPGGVLMVLLCFWRAFGWKRPKSGLQLKTIQSSNVCRI